MKYYIYTHLNPETKEVFYVGLGKKNRAWNPSGRNNFWQNYVNKYGYEVEIIAENLTRKQAAKIEMELIAKLGRKQLDEGGTLVNRSTGGEGSIGYTHTEEFKREMSKKRKGKTKKPHSQATKDKLSQALKGKTDHITWNKPVLQYDKQGNFIKEWKSIKEARTHTGARSIWEVASGYQNNKFKSSGGYIWKYKK